MKKLIALVLTLACVLALTGCGKNDTYKIKIVVLQEVPKKLFIKRILSIPMRKSPR